MAATVQRDVEAMLRALYAGDFWVIVNYTHPRILAGLGGLEPARDAIEASIAPMLKRGLRIESLTFPRPPEFLETPQAVFAIVPTLMILALDERRVESFNYQFGVLDAGATAWKYAEGSRIRQDNVQALFPSFPADYKFPDIYRKRL